MLPRHKFQKATDEMYSNDENINDFGQSDWESEWTEPVKNEEIEEIPRPALDLPLPSNLPPLLDPNNLNLPPLLEVDPNNLAGAPEKLFVLEKTSINVKDNT